MIVSRVELSNTTCALFSDATSSCVVKFMIDVCLRLQSTCGVLWIVQGVLCVVKLMHLNATHCDCNVSMRPQHVHDTVVQRMIVVWTARSKCDCVCD